MTHYQEDSGRLLQAIVGLVTSFVAMIFVVLLYVLFTNTNFNYAAIFGGFALVFFIYWFGIISFRLLFNKPNQYGGLFSVGGLRFLSAFLGLACLCTAPLAIYLGHPRAVIGSIGMVAACIKGWTIASKRSGA